MKDDTDMEVRVHPSHHKPFVRLLAVMTGCGAVIVGAAAWMWGVTGATVAVMGWLLITLPVGILKSRAMCDTCVCAQCGKSLNANGQDEHRYLLYACRDCGIVWRSWMRWNASDN